jgi:DNA-binding NarL/FixJ family response regulator
MSIPKILIIDDEKAVRDAIKKALKKENYKILDAKNGKEGLSLLKSETPNLVFLDLKMPDMDGITFLQKIKLKHDDPYHVVVITGHGEDKDINKCYKLGAASFLRKPLSMTEICCIAERCIKSKATELELAEYRENLENLVDQKTTKLQEQMKKLKEKSKALNGANMSLRILIKQLSDAQNEERVSNIPNLKELVLPGKEQLEAILSSPTERAYIENIMLNLNRVTSTFAKKLSQLDYELSPKEIQVADLVRIGLSNKESAIQMNVTKSTVEFHRDNLRNKLGLKHKKKNLRSFILALDASFQEQGKRKNSK